MRMYLSEGVGTFVLVFVGTGAIIANGVSGGDVTLVGIGMAFGLVVSAMIFALGDISGAHINPAVTLAFWLSGRFPKEQVGPYIASQAAGAILASVLLRILFGMEHGLGGTSPNGSLFQTFLMEIILTCILVLVILCVTTGAKEKGITAAIAIGSVVAFDVFLGGPISGASMNPARSLGPVFAGLDILGVFILIPCYFIAPCAGAWLAVVLVAKLHPATLGACTSKEGAGEVESEEVAECIDGEAPGDDEDYTEEEAESRA